MANANRGEVDFAVGEKTYTLRLSLNAIAEIETLLDMGINELIEALKGPFRVANWRVLLWGALREHHAGVSLDDAGEVMGEAGIEATVAALNKAMTLAFPDAKAAGENPPKASRRAGKTS